MTMMTRRMVTDTHKTDSDDVLYTLRADNNLVVDDDVRQDDGLLYSMKERQAFIWFPSIPLFRWSVPDESPYLSQQVFFVAHEMEEPSNISRAMNGVTEACISKAAAGEDHVGNPQVDAVSKTAIACMVIVGVIFLIAVLLAFNSTQQRNQTAAEKPAAAAAPAAAPAAPAETSPAAVVSPEGAAEPIPAGAVTDGTPTPTPEPTATPTPLPPGASDGNPVDNRDAEPALPGSTADLERQRLEALQELVAEELRLQDEQEDAEEQEDDDAGGAGN